MAAPCTKRVSGQTLRNIDARPREMRWQAYTTNWRLTKRLASRHITSTAAGHAAHATAPRNATSARIAMKSARRGRREERAKKKYEPYRSRASD